MMRGLAIPNGINVPKWYARFHHQRKGGPR